MAVANSGIFLYYILVNWFIPFQKCVGLFLELLQFNSIFQYFQLVGSRHSAILYRYVSSLFVKSLSLIFSIYF